MAREFGDDDAGPPFESASPPGTVSDTPSPARGVPPAGPAPVTESFAASEDDYDYVRDSIHDTVFADDDARPGVSEAFVDVSGGAPAGRTFPPPGLSLTRARPGDGVECRICLMEDGDDFVSPCNCIGTLRHVLAGCLARWCRETGVTTCELCHGHFPARFIDAGKGVRLERELAERARLEAHERLERLAANFEAAYGRPPRTPTDFAVINLNSVLEGEAEARRRANTLDPETRDRLGPGAEVVVIDAGGRAQTLNTRDIGPRGFVERLLLSELERAEALSASASARRAGGPEETFGFDAAFALDDRYGYGDPLSGDPSSDALDRRARAAAHVRFWLRVLAAALMAFLALYVVVVVVAAGDGAGGSYPQFILRLVGFTLPLVLIGRAAYVYRRRREEALLRRVNEAFAIARSDEERAFAAALEMEEARARREAARDDEERPAGEDGGEEERRPRATRVVDGVV